MMFRAYLALLLAFIVTLGRAAENDRYFECRPKQVTSDNHGEVMNLAKGLIGKITELESGFKSIQKAVLLIQSNCNKRLPEPPVIEIEPTVLATEPTVLETEPANIRDGPCPLNYQIFEGACYLFSSDKEDWSTAQQKCRGNGGNLVKITSDNEYLFIQNTITDNTWVGLSDLDSEGQFKWIADGSIFPTGTSRSRRSARSVDGSGSGSGSGSGPYSANYDTYEDTDNDDYGWGEDYYLDEDDDDADDGLAWWLAGEPNNDRNGEDCVEFKYTSGTYQLNDVPCEFRQNYVCQTEAIYPDGQ